jgi:hypothetical protein
MAFSRGFLFSPHLAQIPQNTSLLPVIVDTFYTFVNLTGYHEYARAGKWGAFRRLFF